VVFIATRRPSRKELRRRAGVFQACSPSLERVGLSVRRVYLGEAARTLEKVAIRGCGHVDRRDRTLAAVDLKRPLQ